jgi:hypothetical protein
MAVKLSPLAGAGWQFFDNLGIPLAGGLLYTYTAGTTTPQATYTSSAGTIANANPIVLDSAGRTTNQTWLTVGVAYKLVLQTAAAVTIGTYDNISGINDLTGITSGTSILRGDGAGGIGNVTIGSGLSYVGSTLSTTGQSLPSSGGGYLYRDSISSALNYDLIIKRAALPVATTAQIGALRPDGTTITIGGTNNEIISAVATTPTISTGVLQFSLYYKVTSGSDTFTVPSGVTRLRATIGSGVYSNGVTVIYTVAAGFVTVTPGQTIAVTVASGGGNTSLGAFLTAQGPGTSSTPGPAGGTALNSTFSIGSANYITKTFDGALANQCRGATSIVPVQALFDGASPPTLNGFVIIEY